jgi:acetylornithine deacetylase/succinyl-diaminopimelate desuccinylase-like protein
MSRTDAIADVERYFDAGVFFADLARRVAIATKSQNPARHGELTAYLDTEMRACLERLGMTCHLLANPTGHGGPFLVAERHEHHELPTMLMYGHGDVIRGQDEQWRAGLAP